MPTNAELQYQAYLLNLQTPGYQDPFGGYLRGPPIFEVPKKDPNPLADVPSDPFGQFPLIGESPSYGNSAYGNLMADLQREAAYAEARMRQSLADQYAYQALVNKRITISSRILINNQISEILGRPIINTGTVYVNTLPQYFWVIVVNWLSQEGVRQAPVVEYVESGRANEEFWYWVEKTKGYDQYIFQDLLASTTFGATHLMKYSDSWLTNSFKIGIAGILALPLVLHLLSNNLGMLELDADEFIDKSDDSQDPVVPVRINSSYGQITNANIANGTKTIIDVAKPTVDESPRIRYGNSTLRYYPSSIPLSPLEIPGIYVRPQDRTTPRADIRPAKLSLTLTGPTTMVITKTSQEAIVGFSEENRRSHDKKTYAAVQYNAMLKIAHFGLGTVTEVMDFVGAVLGNVKVKIGGQWLTLGSMHPEAREYAVQGMHSGELTYTVDWQGAARDLLANELIDRKVGIMANLETQSMLDAGILNTFGKGTTWASRLGN